MVMVVVVVVVRDNNDNGDGSNGVVMTIGDGGGCGDGEIIKESKYQETVQCAEVQEGIRREGRLNAGRDTF